jgi:PAS domain S-box-containing protein
MSLDLNNTYKEIEYNKNYFNNLFNSLHSIIITVNNKGSIVQWNKAAEYFFSVPFDKAYNKIIWEVLPLLNKYKNEFKKTIKTRKRKNFYNILFNTPEKKYLNISFQPLLFEKNQEIVIMIEDVTDLEKKESLLRQTQKMEMIGTLASGLAHDFNNILAAILGTISIIKLKLDNSKPISSENMQSYVSMINDSTMRASEIVKQLSALSRKQELNLDTIDLNNSIKNVVNIIENSFDKSIKVLPIYLKSAANVHADATQIEQIMLNISINAAHAMTIMRKNNEWGGILNIELKHLHADKSFCKQHPAAHIGSYYCLSIIDNGVGMDEEVLKDIFTPFYTTKEKGSGTGLGLSMVYNIVQLHQGFLNVYSKTEIGTTFNIYLPEIDARKKESNKPIIKKTDFHYEGTILMIDDEKALHTVVEDMLSEFGLTTLYAENGLSGIELYQEKRSEIQLVLLDMAMPGLSGKEIDPQVKVILSSGYKQDQRVADVLKLGINGFVQKPFTVNSLLMEVIKVLNSLS